MNIAIIAAGGKSERLGKEVPKPFLRLHHLPIIVYSIRKFESIGIQTHVVIPEEYTEMWLEIKSASEVQTPSYSFGKHTRYLSIKHAIDTLKIKPDIVFIHDAARPFFRPKLISQMLQKMENSNCCIPISPVTDTIKVIKNAEVEHTPDRSSLYATQTPMAINYSELKKRYETNTDMSLTDESQLFENDNQTIKTVTSDPFNIKITHPHDLILAEWIASNQNNKS